MSFCTSCGNKLTDEVAFCPNCGTKKIDSSSPQLASPNSAGEDFALQEGGVTRFRRNEAGVLILTNKKLEVTWDDTEVVETYPLESILQVIDYKDTNQLGLLLKDGTQVNFQPLEDLSWYNNVVKAANQPAIVDVRKSIVPSNAVNVGHGLAGSSKIPGVVDSRKLRYWLIGALVIALLIANNLFNNSNNPTTSNGTGQATPSGQQGVIGQPSDDGQFTFTVSALRCGFKTVGSDGFGGVGSTAQGQYCSVKIEVLNHSNSSQYYFVSAQFAYDDQNNKYTADSSADIYGNPPSGMDGTTINPGNKISGTLYFDVPLNVSISSVELHDSLYSGGVTIQVYA